MFFIVRPNRKIQVDTKVFHPGIRYVVPQVEAGRFKKHMVDSHSSWNNYNRAPRRGMRRVVVYRHSAWGDQLMATGVVKLLKDKLPGTQVDVYCAPQVVELWADGYADNVYPTPMTFDAATWYEGHVFYEGMLEMDSEPEQGNAFDNMIGFAGFDPKTVDSFYKRPHLRG